MDKTRISTLRVSYSALSIVVFLLYCVFQLLLESKYTAINYSLVALMFAFVSKSQNFQIRIGKNSSQILILYLLSLIYMFISYLFARNLSLTGSARIKTVFIQTLIAMLLIVISQTGIKFDTVFGGITLILFITTLEGFVNIGINNIIRLIRTGSRTIDEYGSEFGTNYYAMVACIGFMLILFFAIKRNKIAYYIFCLPSLLLALASGSRKAIVSILIGVFLLLFLMSKKKTIINLARWIVVLIVFMLVLQKIPFFDAIIMRISTLWNASNDLSVGLSDMGRLNRITWGFENFLHKPIFGYGFNSFGYYYGMSFGTESYAHNNYVQLLFDQGIIGFTLYYSYLVLIFIRLIKLWNKNDLFAPILIVICFLSFVFDWGSVTYYQFLSKLIHMLCGSYIIAKYSDNFGADRKNEISQ